MFLNLNKTTQSKLYTEYICCTFKATLDKKYYGKPAILKQDLEADVRKKSELGEDQQVSKIAPDVSVAISLENTDYTVTPRPV